MVAADAREGAMVSAPRSRIKNSDKDGRGRITKTRGWELTAGRRKNKNCPSLGVSGRRAAEVTAPSSFTIYLVELKTFFCSWMK
jgi:hypothetical protein